MRVRTRDTFTSWSGLLTRRVSRNYINTCFPNSRSDTLVELTGNYRSKVSTISDEIGSPDVEMVYNGRGKWKPRKLPKFPMSRVRGYASLPPWLAEKRFQKPIRKCVHDQTSYSVAKGDMKLFSEVHLDIGNFCHERWESYDTLYPNREVFLFDTLGFDPYTAFHSGVPVLYTADAYRTHDWFALMDSFQEACESYCSSNFLLGEDLVQNDIFRDALGLIFHPSRSIGKFIKHTIQHVKGYRGKTLGQISSRLSRKGSQSFLSYNFGIKPAVDDILKVLDAHSKVSTRLDYLRQNAGDYVPIRVRKKLSSDVSLSSISAQGSWGRYISCNSKDTTATMSCYGRVREDLNTESTWSAYLQYFGVNKVVGLVWELIPFSFVLDWVTNAQERINYYTRLRTGGPFVDFKGFCCSEKQQLVETLVGVPPMSLSDPSDPLDMAYKVTSSYKRLLEIPDTSGVVDLTTLGLFQALATGAMGIQLLQR